MSFCHRLKRGWEAFKSIIYDYDDASYREREEQAKRKARANDGKREDNRDEHLFECSSNAEVTRIDYYERTMPPESRKTYCIPKRDTKYEAYGIEFETHQERDAFECKMMRMERILEKELYDIKQQHRRLQKERQNLTLLQEKQRQRSSSRSSIVDTSRNTSVASSDAESSSSFFSSSRFDRLSEEISLLNEFQDIFEQMYTSNRELQSIERILLIEVRERTLHPEPRLIHIKAPEDEFSQQMKMEGGLRYYSADNTVQQISYDRLPPPLSLNRLLANERSNR